MRMKSMRPACLTLLFAATAATAAGDFSSPQWADQIRRLDDRDPHVRDAARVALMGMSMDDMAYLKKAVVAAGPVRPHRAMALRNVLTYVYTRHALARVPRQGTGFLGVSLEPGVFLDADDAAPGQMVLDTVPGFVGARYLSVGDVICGVTADGQTESVTRGRLVTDIISKFKPGKTVELLIRRDGHSITITLPLDDRPDLTQRADDTGRSALDYYLSEKVEADAETEVVKEFGRLVGEG